ncbi:hypothetical protein MD484_g5298, partial [Candolleomyces efflorescens]
MFNVPYGFYGGNPFLHSSYIPDQQPYYQQPPRSYYNPREQLAQQARARALAEQRARRSQWLPEEDDDDDYSEEDGQYGPLGLRERLYLDARKRQQQLERQERMRQEQELVRRRAAEERERQLQLEQRAREENERQRQVLEEQRSNMLRQQKRERMSQLFEERERQNAHREASRSPSRSPASSPSPSPQEPAPLPTPQYDEKHEEAASVIQQQFRIHQSLKSIGASQNKFKDLKNGFTFPTTIEFIQPGAPDVHIFVETQRRPLAEGEEPAPVDSDGKLAYTLRNYPLHAYVEALSKLLMELDGVNSWGSADVRKRRRGVVKEIEQEVQRVEAYWKGAWQDYVEAQKEEMQVEEAVQTDEDM